MNKEARYDKALDQTPKGTIISCGHLHMSPEAAHQCDQLSPTLKPLAVFMLYSVKTSGGEIWNREKMREA